MSTQTSLRARGWTLENRDAGHFKFYTAILVENGTAVFHWGRIGTRGQHKLELLSQGSAERAVLRKVHEKASKGYEYRHDDVAWTVDERDVEGAQGLGRERNDPGRLTMLFDRALRDPKFTGDKQAVLVGYDAFLDKAQGLMDRAATMPFESVMNDFEELKQSWVEIADKHSLAATTIGMTEQLLMKALVEGRL
ncbi:MAG: WGR domain-containing protein [Nonomuraea sp.]|nr:WGR domain-containing protein [Nonomuraea sp.]